MIDFIESQASQIVRYILNSENSYSKQDKMGIVESMKNTNPKFLKILIETKQSYHGGL